MNWIKVGKELTIVHKAFVDYTKFIEKDFVGNREDLKRVCTANTHQLLHLVECIRKTGMPFANWQYGSDYT
jgi:hypothetical protein